MVQDSILRYGRLCSRSTNVNDCVRLPPGPRKATGWDHAVEVLYGTVR